MDVTFCFLMVCASYLLEYVTLVFSLNFQMKFPVKHHFILQFLSPSTSTSKLIILKQSSPSVGFKKLKECISRNWEYNWVHCLMNSTIRMNYGAMVLNYTDPTSVLLGKTRNFLIFLLGQYGFILEAQWSILVSCILNSFISLVKAYMLGLPIFFHSLMEFFIDGRKGIIFFKPFFFF